MLRRTFVRILLLLAAFGALAVSLPAKKKPPAAPINLNTATSEELQLVPGIGPVTAEKILQMRKSCGAFKSVDDLSAIRGIGPKRLEKSASISPSARRRPRPNPPAFPSLRLLQILPPLLLIRQVHCRNFRRLQRMKRKADSSLRSE
jgi:competence ComEA-like helix-hairpin-helix protein